MKAGFASALAATIAMGEQVLEADRGYDLLDLDDLGGKDLIEPVKQDYSNVAPVALLHGVNSGCNNVAEWVTRISDSLDNQVPVKCVEIGDGKNTSMFMRMWWQADVVCHKLHNDPVFAGKEINLLGIS